MFVRFSPFSIFFDRFRSNGHHHVNPLIEIYRSIQLSSRTDDINIDFGRFFDFWIFVSIEKVSKSIDLSNLAIFRQHHRILLVETRRTVVLSSQTDIISVIYGQNIVFDFLNFWSKIVFSSKTNIFMGYGSNGDQIRIRRIEKIRMDELSAHIDCTKPSKHYLMYFPIQKIIPPYLSLCR